ncbi:MAG: glycosyltransferase family 1 protein [Bacteroidetes bacterium]|nr:glycosyltransferase family 1 protein [Bacteroidota bacterium]MDA1119618.1 glycosyltransferase family 1 protein [Bacteroidota bacterium]
MRVLHCPTTIGGNPQGLSKAEKEIGLESKSITFHQNLFNYKADEVIYSQDTGMLMAEYLRWKTILTEIPKADIIHYNFGQWLAPREFKSDIGRVPKIVRRLYNSIYLSRTMAMDLRFARKLNKVIAVTYQGDDARQLDFVKKHYKIHFAHEEDYDSSLFFSDSHKRKEINLFDRYADLIYALNPDLLNVLPKRTKYMAYASVDPREWSCLPIDDLIEEPHVVHAPSDRTVKGTRYLIEAMERLKSEGFRFTYTLVEGYSNREAKEIYKTADLLVDQLLVGFYGGLSVELMALGKPVICYLREEDIQLLPREMKEEIPIINAQPNTIYEVLKEWLTVRKGDIKKKGIESRRYVEKWHDPIKIAKSLKIDYQAILEKKGK